MRIEQFITVTGPLKAQELLYKIYDEFNYNSNKNASKIIVTPPCITAPTTSVIAANVDSTAYSSVTWINQAVTLHYTCRDVGCTDPNTANIPAEINYSEKRIHTAQSEISDNADTISDAEAIEGITHYVWSSVIGVTSFVVLNGYIYMDIWRTDIQAILYLLYRVVV
ncbi:MAG: hypothetical protein WCU00_06520 [Candidatus Latescibacterota bacterium]